MRACVAAAARDHSSAMPTAMLLTVRPASSSVGGFSTTTIRCFLSPPALPPCAPPGALVEGAAGVVMKSHAAHLTDCAPCVYRSVVWHPPHRQCATWFAASTQRVGRSGQ
jgi:hypothetical protein